jgi:hypothetical protein
MREYIMNTIAWIINPIVNRIDEFRNWTRRKEIVAERNRMVRQRQADELCDELLREYMIELHSDRVDDRDFDSKANSFTKKLTRFYLLVR